MSSSHMQRQILDGDDVYLQIWQTEQDHVRTRWTVVTFFLGVSFAIFGFSFQNKLSGSQTIAIRIAGLFIYWFAYFLLLHFYEFTKFLRTYLLDMEKSGRTSLDIQSKADASRLDASKRLSTTRLLLLFGLIYTIGIITLWLMGL